MLRKEPEWRVLNPSGNDIQERHLPIPEGKANRSIHDTDACGDPEK